MKIKVIFILLLLITLTGCFGGESGGTTTGNPIVQMKLSSFDQSATQKIANFYKVDAQNVSTIVMCFKRLRFKMANETTNSSPDLDSDNIDLEIGEVVLDPTGTQLTEVSIPAGTYTRIEFDLEKDCPSGNSIDFVNDSGTFNTDERITIKFEGQFIANESVELLTLGIQNIINAIDTVTNNADIKTSLESVSGDM